MYKFAKSSHTLGSFTADFTPRTRVEGVLYLLRPGYVERICSQLMMRGVEADLDEPQDGVPWRTEVTLWLEEKPAEEGRTHYGLESTGCRGSRSWNLGKSHGTVPTSESCVLFGGDLTREIPRQDAILFYIGGDRRPFRASSTRDLMDVLSRFHRQEKRRRMTPREFGEQSPGNFLVITLRWFDVDADQK